MARTEGLSDLNVSLDPTFATSQLVKFLPKSTVGAIIVKRKHLAAQPQSGRPHKLTERGRRPLKHVTVPAN